MAEDKKSAEIRRMACQKVAVEIVGPAPAKFTDAYKKRFVEILDWLDQDVTNAQPVLQGTVDIDRETASIPVSTNGGTLSLDEAIELTDWLRETAADNPGLQNQIKLTLVGMGVRNPKSLDEAVSKLNKTQAIQLKETIKEKIE